MTGSGAGRNALDPAQIVQPRIAAEIRVSRSATHRSRRAPSIDREIQPKASQLIENKHPGPNAIARFPRLFRASESYCATAKAKV
jgi:hypothetical protein